VGVRDGSDSFGGEVGRFGCQNDGLDEADTVVEEGGREGGREGETTNLGVCAGRRRRPQRQGRSRQR